MGCVNVVIYLHVWLTSNYQISDAVNLLLYCSTPAGKRYHHLQQQIEKLQEEVFKLEAGTLTLSVWYPLICVTISWIYFMPCLTSYYEHYSMKVMFFLVSWHAVNQLLIISFVKKGVVYNKK